MGQLVLRFLIGGAVVSLFAILGDLLKPKSFAGLFGAAPSVALATLALTVRSESARYASAEARSMVLGALALFLYTSAVSWILMRYRVSALAVTECDPGVGGDCVWAVVSGNAVIKAIKFEWAAIAQSRWQEQALRFVAGGAITAAAGLIAKEFGPGIGGLFLAFPAIFPASATLVEKHERERKEEEGVRGAERGRQAASLDAAGAAMGSLGLLVFALLVWKLLPMLNAWIVLPLTTLVWLGVSMLVWVLRKKY